MQTIIKLNETFTGPKKKEELWWMLPIDAGYNQQHDIWTKFFQGCTRNFDKIVFRQENSEKYTSNYYDEKTGYFELSGDTNVANQPQSDESYLNTPNEKEAMFLHKINDKGENEYKFIGIFEKRAYIKSMNKYIFVRVDTDLVCEMKPFDYSEGFYINNFKNKTEPRGFIMKESLQDFKKNVMTMLKQHYGENSTQRIWLKIKDKMNDSKNSIFWTDVESYYNKISTRLDAIYLLENSNLALRSNNINQMTKTQENMTALQYSIYAKFFTKTDCECSCWFADRLYNQHKNNSKKDREMWAEKNDVIIMMLKAGLSDN